MIYNYNIGTRTIATVCLSCVHFTGTLYGNGETQTTFLTSASASASVASRHRKNPHAATYAT